MSEVPIRTDEQERNLRALADSLPTPDPEAAVPDWVERARHEVARRAIQAANEQPEA